MGKSLADIDNFDASLIVADYLMCTACFIVDRDRSRIATGSTCSICGISGRTAQLYFPITVHILVDLAHQAFHSTSKVGSISGPQGKDVGPIVYFCALREALLNQFLLHLMQAQHIPAAVMERLLDDNKLAHQKFGPLFKSIVGASWADAIASISSNAIDFHETSELMKRAASARNKFVHHGSPWAATPVLAKECVNMLATLTSLFVALHNFYVHPLRHKP